MISILDELDLRDVPNNHVLYFYANWVPKSIAGHMHRMAAKAEEFGVPVYAIDVEAFKSQVKKNDVIRVPTLLFFVDGSLSKKIEGYILTATYKAVLRELYKKEIEGLDEKRRSS